MISLIRLWNKIMAVNTETIDAVEKLLKIISMAL